MFGIHFSEQALLTIDRSQPFDYAKLDDTVSGWGFVRQDERSLALTEIDPAKIRLVPVNPGTGYIRLDAKFLQTFLENPHLIPEAFKDWVAQRGRIVPAIFFEGSVLWGPLGEDYCILCLCHDNSKDQWFWDHDFPLLHAPENGYVSAVLES